MKRDEDIAPVIRVLLGRTTREKRPWDLSRELMMKKETSTPKLDVETKPGEREKEKKKNNTGQRRGISWNGDSDHWRRKRGTSEKHN